MSHEVLQAHVPEDMAIPRPLPGIRPVDGAWLKVDEAYAGQMARRVDILARHRDAVLDCCEDALEPARELLDEVLVQLPALGFDRTGETVLCPDGRRVTLDRDDPLGTLGLLVQCDFCLHDKVGDEHMLKAAVLCFPASWMLSEKIRRPLTGVHEPVDEYGDDLARRVQRLFDGIQVGRPIWRFNDLHYADPELFQPRSQSERRDPVPPGQKGNFRRLERQTLLRLPRTRWVVFAIHTIVVKVAS